MLWIGVCSVCKRGVTFDGTRQGYQHTAREAGSLIHTRPEALSFGR